MKTIGERIESLIKTLNKNAYNFGKSIDKPNTTIANIITNKSKPGSEILEAILSKYPQVNPEWLITGEGEMFKQEKKRDAVDSGYLIEYITKLEENFNRLSEQLTVKDQQINKMLDLLGKPSDVVEAPTRLLRSLYLAQA